MAKFLYLFRNKESAETRPSPEQIEQLTRLWMSWMETLRASGHLVKAGERLDRTGKVVRGRAKVVTDGPYAESKDTIGGYLLMEAANLDEAVELSKGCPIFESDGIVEVRPLASL